MANTGKTIATLLIGAAVGAAVGYVFAMDEDKRKKNLDMLKGKMNDLKSKLNNKAEELEENIYSS